MGEDDDMGGSTISQEHLDAFPTSSAQSPDSLLTGDSTDAVTEFSLDELDVQNPDAQPLSPIEVLMVLKSMREDVPELAKGFAVKLGLYIKALRAVSGMCAISQKEIQELRGIEDVLVALEEMPATVTHNPGLLTNAMRMLDSVAASLSEHIEQLHNQTTAVGCGVHVIEELQRENVVLHTDLTEEQARHKAALDAYTQLVQRVKEAKLYFQNRLNTIGAQLAERDQRISALEAQLAEAKATIKRMQDAQEQDAAAEPVVKRARPTWG